MKPFLRILIGLTFGLPAFARLGGTLPGGLLYPSFATSSLTNAAALTSEWGNELVALYSPSLRSDSPHAMLGAFAFNARTFGLNVGYNGSTQSGTTYHNVFAGASARFGNLSLGLAAKKIDIQTTGNPTFDFSWMYYKGDWRLGMTAFDIGGARLLGMGIGTGPPDTFTMEADILMPMTLDQNRIKSDYGATLALTGYISRVGFCLGGHYEKIDTAEIQNSSTSLTAGVLVRLMGKWNAVVLGNTSPASISFGIAWNDFATPQQVYRHFQAQRKSSIQKSRR